MFFHFYGPDQCSKRLVTCKEHCCFDHSDFPAHSMFTSDVCWGTLGTSIFGTQVQQQVILDPDYLPDYLSVSYDYGYTYVQIKFLDNFFFQKFSTPTFYNSPFFGFYLHFFKLFVFLPLPSLIAHFGKFLSLPFTKGGWKWQEEIKSYILVTLKVNLL